MFRSISLQDLRSFLAINFSAFCMLVVVLLMLSLVSVVIYLGASHLWEKDIYLVEYEHLGRPQKLYAQLGTGWAKQIKQGKPIVLSYPDPKRVAFDRLALQSTLITRITKPENVANWYLHSGRVKFGLAGRLLKNGQISQQISLTEAINEIREAEQAISEHYDDQLLSIHKQIAELAQAGVLTSSPQYQRDYQTYLSLEQTLTDLRAKIAAYEIQIEDASGEVETVPVKNLVHYSYVNQQGVMGKLVATVANFFELLVKSPTSNFQSGGFFPAMFGTLTMVLLMTLFVTPLGVLVAVYLHEYAPRSWGTTLIRISVNNLAGVPSIVYGVFGLGFFVYGLGGQIDQLLFKEQLPSPTFGAPGLLWASLTMAILTLPVVIVATEEGLKRVPKNLLVGSYALGATKLETVWRIALPLASPGILTGIIMAIARGAGEVAPLLLVGAVKFAPLLPVDDIYPYVHLERQFMHLGTLIFHGTFNSLDPEFGASMIFVSCTLLLLLVLSLNLVAISVRNKLRARYSMMVSE